MGGRWKSQNRKNMYLSPYVEEPLNSKVIKSFVPKLRSRNCFFVFRDSYVLCIYVMNILCTFCVAISWLCDTNNSIKNQPLVCTRLNGFKFRNWLHISILPIQDTEAELGIFLYNNKRLYYKTTLILIWKINNRIKR